MQPVIEMCGVAKRFGHTVALDHVDLTVGPGELVALLGPNGAGKSTLTRILATIVLPDIGTAKVCGHDVVSQSARVRRSIGVTLSEERSWYWRLSGRRNLEFFAALYGFNRRDAAERSAALLHQLDLSEAADRRFDGYSAGMKARLSLARALLPDPPVLLLDEPTRSLDPVATAVFREVLRDLVQKQHKAVLLTTHDLHEAANLATRIVFLVKGRISNTAAGDTSAETLEKLLLEASIS